MSVNCTVVKVVNKGKKYVAKNGKEYVNTNYYLKLENGKYLAIRPCFAKEYALLDTICDTVVNG